MVTADMFVPFRELKLHVAAGFQSAGAKSILLCEGLMYVILSALLTLLLPILIKSDSKIVALFSPKTSSKSIKTY